MVGEAWRHELDARLVVWPGPPPLDLSKHPSVLREMAREAGADTVVVDSLKDAFIGLNDDEAAAGWNRARQTAIADGVQLIELHHNRKALAGAKSERLSIDSVYGSTWITSGAGSVVLLTGAPGDPIVGLRHLKQPAAEVGPMQVAHDHTAGRSRLWHGTDLVEVARLKAGISAKNAATALFGSDTPANTEKARRKLRALERDGRLKVLNPGQQETSTATVWGSR